MLGPFKVGNNPYSAEVGDLDLDGTQISVPYTGLSIPTQLCSTPPILRTAQATTERVHPLTSLLHKRRKKEIQAES